MKRIRDTRKGRRDMARLIDAEHLTKWILSWWEQTSPTSEYLKGADILAQIDRELTIDAVSVVRCKDCKWRNTKRCIINFFAEDLTDDKFCAWGERSRR